MREGNESPFSSTHMNGEAVDQESLDALSDLYDALKEEDLWTGLWVKRGRYKETVTGIRYESQGFFEQAQGQYELAMRKGRSDYGSTPPPSSLNSEFRLWEKHWIRCSKELNQWDLLLEYGTSKNSLNPMLILDSSWRVPNWTLFKESLLAVEQNCAKEHMYRVAMYKGYNCICNPEEVNLQVVERMSELASTFCIKEWRRLPSVISHIHIPLLQAAQQIMELQEAGQIHSGFAVQGTVSRMGGGIASSQLHDMKAIVKTWRNRLPVLADDLSHWSDIFAWRQHHYQAIVSHYDSSSLTLPSVAGNSNTSAAAQPGPGQQTTSAGPSSSAGENQASHAMLGVHASAQSIIYYGKVARKHGLISVCLDSLNRIHTIPSVPIVDCFQKIRQQVKCYLHTSNSGSTPSSVTVPPSVFGTPSSASGGTGTKSELQEGLEVIESTNLKYFSKEMTAEFYALKGLFLASTGRLEDANKAFSAAVQLHDNLNKAWALWADYLESKRLFLSFWRQSSTFGANLCFHFSSLCQQILSTNYLISLLSTQLIHPTNPSSN